MSIDVLAQQYQTIRIVALVTQPDPADSTQTVVVDLTDALFPQGWLVFERGGLAIAGVGSVSDAAAGEVTLLFADTALWAADLSVDLPPGRYPWEFWLQLPTSGDRLPILSGTIQIVASAKRPTWS